MTLNNLGTPYHAWYSLKQAKNRCCNNSYDVKKKKNNTPASIYYLDKDKKKIEVTMVSKSLEHGCNTKFIDDLEYKGIVYKYFGICCKNK